MMATSHYHEDDEGDDDKDTYNERRNDNSHSVGDADEVLSVVATMMLMVWVLSMQVQRVGSSRASSPSVLQPRDTLPLCLDVGLGVTL